MFCNIFFSDTYNPIKCSTPLMWSNYLPNTVLILIVNTNITNILSHFCLLGFQKRKWTGPESALNLARSEFRTRWTASETLQGVFWEGEDYCSSMPLLCANESSTTRETIDGEEGGGGVRLPVQGGVDRGFWGGEVEHPVPLHSQRVLPRDQIHPRRRIRHPYSPSLSSTGSPPLSSFTPRLGLLFSCFLDQRFVCVIFSLELLLPWWTLLWFPRRGLSI